MLMINIYYIMINIILINNIMLVSGVEQSDQLHVYMYLFFFKLFSHLGCYIRLSRVTCAI